MFAIIDENGKITQVSVKKPEGIASYFASDEGGNKWKIVEFDDSLSSKFIKFDPDSQSIIEDIDKKQEKENEIAKKDLALIKLKSFDPKTEDIAVIAETVKALIDYLANVKSAVMSVKIKKNP